MPRLQVWKLCSDDWQGVFGVSCKEITMIRSGLIVPIKDSCPCKNLSHAVDHNLCAFIVAAGCEIKMWFVNCAAACRELLPAGMPGISKMSNPCQACRASLTAALAQS